MKSHKINFELVSKTPSNPKTAEEYDVWYLYLGDTFIAWGLYEKECSLTYILRELFKQYLEGL